MTPHGIQDADREAISAAPTWQGDELRATATHQPTLLASLQGLLRKLPGLVSDRVELLSLEMQRAGQVLARIVALVIVAAIAGLTAWLALWGGVTLALINAGLHWAVATLVVLVINLGACWWAVARARALQPQLDLPATRRHLTLSQPSTTTKPPSPDENAKHPAGASAGTH